MKFHKEGYPTLLVTILFSAIIISIVLNNDIKIIISYILLWIFVSYRHKDNIKRVLNKEEKKITWMG